VPRGCDAKRLKLIAAGGATALALLAAASASSGSTVGVRAGGEPEANGGSFYAAISADGRFVTFTSIASNLMPGDTNRASDVFVYDRQTSSTTRVSVSSDRAQGNDHSGGSAITPDGRFVAFNSNASNLVAGDTNGHGDVFVHDRGSGSTTRASGGSQGVQANNSSGVCGLSGDGRFVLLTSYASNLVPADTNAVADVFVHDLRNGATSRVSVDSAGAQANSDSGGCRLSADARFVAFSSLASNLVSGDTNNALDIFVHDRQSGTTTRVSVASGGVQARGASYAPSISDDGRRLAFTSDASNLVAGDTNGVNDVFVHDRQSGETSRVSVAPGGAQANARSGYHGVTLSADGHFVTFDSEASNLVAGDTNRTSDVFVHDLQSGMTTRVNVSSAGAQANGSGQSSSLDADGHFVAFDSYASNLVAEDTNDASDVFLHDLEDGATTRISGGAVGVQCRVPSLIGLPLATARARIRRANCSLSQIRTARSSRAKGRVLAQRPRPGATLHRGGPVSLVVSRGRRSAVGKTFIVFRCGEGYANLCGTVPETGAFRQLTFDGDPHRSGDRAYVRFHRGYHSPSLSNDGKLLSFAFEGSAYLARQSTKGRVRVGRSTKAGFTSIRPDRHRVAIVDRVLRCIGSRETGSCRGWGTLIVRSARGKVMRRISDVWEADWAGTRLLASRTSDHLSLFSGRGLRTERVLIDHRKPLLEPAVSPDGRLVAVRLGAAQGRNSIALFSLATGKFVRRLTKGSSDSDPDWSPDGKRIVFTRYTSPCKQADTCTELYTVRSDGRGQPRSLGIPGVEPTWGEQRH
jgi:Tol biopolymer transport system component